MNVTRIFIYNYCDIEIDVLMFLVDDCNFFPQYLNFLQCQRQTKKFADKFFFSYKRFMMF